MLKERKQELVKDTIIKETKRQLLEKGIYKTSLRGIAKELGIAFGNIYYYYKTKADIADMVWAEYTHNYIKLFKKEMNKSKWQKANGMEKLKYYYSYLFEYFAENPLYAELIAFLMGEKPRSVRSPQEIIDTADEARDVIKGTLKELYETAIKDNSIKAVIKDITLEAWSFNIAFTIMIINIIRYDEMDNETLDYFVETYFERLERM